MNRFVLIAAGAMLAALLATAVSAKTLADPEYRAKVASQFPGVTADEIVPSKVDGLWRIVQEGMVGYLTANGRYLLTGDLIDLKRDVNLSAKVRRDWRLEQIAQMPESKMLIYAPPDPEHTVTVFTDVNCFFCRQFHHKIDKLLDAGIRVRYMFYPLLGPHSASYHQARAIWCSEDRHAAMDAAMQGQHISSEIDCETPIAAHYKLAAKTLGLRGTPSIITEDGHLLHADVSMSELIDRVTDSGQG